MIVLRVLVTGHALAGVISVSVLANILNQPVYKEENMAGPRSKILLSSKR
jgi:hypothetical protein